MNYERLNNLSKKVAKEKKKKLTIVLDQMDRVFSNGKIDINLSVERKNWKITPEMEKYIDQLVDNNDINFEEKILEIYLKLCKDYVYDDNVLSYLQIKEQDVFELPGFYGKNTSEEWEKNRKKHNKRVCFEMARELAKSLTCLIEKSGKSDDYDICILWDQDMVHYNVGLASDEYSLILDLDDFNKIKDLSRVKLDLTVNGIEILEDKKGKFKKTIDSYNSSKIGESQKQVAQHLEKKEKNQNGPAKEQDLEFLESALEVIKDGYNLDPAGIFEYMKEIVDTKLGSEFRKKVWKEGTNKYGEKIYTRCLIVTLGKQKYYIDVTQEDSSKMIKPVTEQEYSKLGIIPSLHRSADEEYSGR